MTKIKISAFFYFVFFGFGVLYPMIGVYFKDIGLTGSQIGLMMSIGPIVSMFAQPVWGILSDRFQNPKKLLSIATFLTGMTVIAFLFTQNYPFLLLLMAILALFQSAIVPISDSITINYCKKEKTEYGNIRLWGAIGFALAVWLTGLAIEASSTHIIFYIFTFMFMISTWFAKEMPSEGESIQIDLRSGLARLMQIPTYPLFLMSSFIFVGTMNANNSYFGIYYTSLGGTIAGVGLVFLIAAGSEAPFMRITGYMIRRVGLLPLLILSTSLSAIRWFIFYLEPSTSVLLAISILQGMSIGFYIPAGVEFVRQLTPIDVKVTGMSIYAAVSAGLGGMFFTFVGGYIYEYFSIAHSYLFFSILTFISILLLIRIGFLRRATDTTRNID